MKKQVCTYIFTLFLLSNSLVFGQQTDFTKDKLLGIINNIKEKSYSSPNGTNNEQKHLISEIETTYNTDGYKVMYSVFKKGKLFAYTKYNYDTNNTLISTKEYNYDNSLYLDVQYTNNEDGKEIIASYDRIMQKTYDKQRLSVDVEYAKYYKNLFTTILYFNDFKGYIIEEKYITKDGNISQKFTYKYDYKHNKVEIKFYNSSGNVSWRKKLKYDSKGNMTESKLFKSNRIAMISKFEYEFDQIKNWTKRTEQRKLYDNFFSDELNNNTVVTTREIQYITR